MKKCQCCNEIVSSLNYENKCQTCVHETCPSDMHNGGDVCLICETQCCCKCETRHYYWEIDSFGCCDTCPVCRFCGEISDNLDDHHLCDQCEVCYLCDRLFNITTHDRYCNNCWPIIEGQYTRDTLVLLLTCAHFKLPKHLIRELQKYLL